MKETLTEKTKRLKRRNVFLLLFITMAYVCSYTKEIDHWAFGGNMVLTITLFFFTAFNCFEPED